MNDDLFKSKYRIPSARAYWHDYNRGYYFITICTYKREHYFGEISNNNMILTEIGLQASILLDKISMKYNGVSIPSYIIMPNHIHLIISIIKNKNIHNHDKIINNNNINEKMSDIAKKTRTSITDNIKIQNISYEICHKEPSIIIQKTYLYH